MWWGEANSNQMQEQATLAGQWEWGAKSGWCCADGEGLGYSAAKR